MPGLDFFAPLAIFAFSTLITPGPNNVIITASGVNFGFQKSLPTILGVCFGFSAMMLFVALGLGNVFSYYPLVYKILRWASFVFMLYLAWKMATANFADEKHDSNSPPGFWKMTAFQWINPKAWAMSSAAAAAFTTVDGHVVFEALLIALTFLFISFPCLFSWGIFGATIGGFLQSTRLRLRLFNITMAMLMLAAFIPVVIR